MTIHFCDTGALRAILEDGEIPAKLVVQVGGAEVLVPTDLETLCRVARDNRVLFEVVEHEQYAAVTLVDA